MNRRSFILGTAWLVAAPAVRADEFVVKIINKKKHNETFDLSRFAGSIYIYGNDLVCCRFIFSPINKTINFSMNYTEFCSFDGLLTAQDSTVVSNVFASSLFTDKDSEYLNRHNNQSVDLEISPYCAAPTS